MAIYVFKMKTFSRSAGHRGSRATSAAAYRAGELIRDTRTGVSYDHRHRQDVLHKEIVLPTEFAEAGRQMEWARSRPTLWNAAEQAETRRNSRVAREFTLALPHELGAAERVRLAQGYAHALAERYHNAVDLVIHAPRGDARNFHAHLLTTTREVTLQGFGRKAALELSGTERHRRGLERWANERAWLREHWAGVTNQALRSAHLEMRVSHLAPATADPAQAPRVPIAAYYMERQGRRSFVAERIRAQHRTRLERAQLERARELTPGRAQSTASTGRSAAIGSRWVERVRERAQTAWLALRERLRGRPAIGVAAWTAAEQRQQAREAAAALPGTAQPAATGRAYLSQIDELQHKSARAWRAYREGLASPGVERAPALGPATPDRTASNAPGPVGGRDHDRGNEYDLSL